VYIRLLKEYEIDRKGIDNDILLRFIITLIKLIKKTIVAIAPQEGKVS